VRIAERHVDDDYRRVLGAFTRAVLARAPGAATPISDEHAALARAASLW
jgi:hypothetical protein